ncbi:MAG: shikimate kinase [Clostridiales bacterium]|nr:shikimate kinase [Clostridiales bacterium]
MSKLRCGLIGNPLGHSWSPEIHAILDDYSYTLWPMEEDAVAPFLKARDFDAINVTIPYKKTVMPHLDRISDEARRIGSVNTVVKEADGTLSGYNTDYFGLSYMLARRGFELRGKKVVILGSGGASVTAQTVAADRGAAQIAVVTHRENTPETLRGHGDAEILINTTPVGMFPHNGESPASLDFFPRLEAVVDMIYNPARTALILDAEERRIPSASGLPMLVAQAKMAAELFTRSPLSDTVFDEALREVSKAKRNLALVGMPGCGKSTVGRLFAEHSGRVFVDLDAEIEKEAGRPIPAIFSSDGEAAFRDLETAVLARFSKASSLVLATGGGAVIRAENRRLLRENSVVLHLTRPLDALAKDGRPLSQANSAETLWNARRDFYRAVSDAALPVDPDPAVTLARVTAWWERFSDKNA